MKREKFAKKTKLVADADEPVLDAGASQSAETQQNEEKIEAVEESSANSTPALSAPDISISNSGQGSRANPITLLYFANSRMKLIVFALLLVIAANIVNTILSQRSADENLFRKYIDQAKLFEMQRKIPEATSSWKSAIAVAIKLGDSDRSIADLYINASKGDYGLSQSDLRSAIALYEKTSDTTLQLIKAKEELLNILVRAPNAMPSQTVLLKDIVHADNLLKENKIDEAIKVYKTVLGERRNLDASRLARLETMLKYQDPLADAALPLYHIAAYNSIDYFDFMPNMAADPYEAQINLDKAITKSGRFPFIAKDRLFLANRAFSREDYRGATVEYQRYLAMEDDDSISRKNLQECYRRLHKPSAQASEIIAIATDLKKIHTQVFGEKSKHVTIMLGELGSAYLDIGDFAKAEEMREALLQRLLADPKTVSEDQFDDCLSLRSAYANLLDLYVLEGKFKAAKELYQQAWKKPSTKGLIKPEHYSSTCLRAGWFSEVAKLRPLMSTQY